MFFVGYLGKGVLMRYRRVEIVEAVEGDTVGLARRYTGYYFTRPSSMRSPSSRLLIFIRDIWKPCITCTRWRKSTDPSYSGCVRKTVPIKFICHR